MRYAGHRTLYMACTAAGELLPLFLIFDSQAKDPENFKIPPAVVAAMPQVQGFGRSNIKELAVTCNTTGTHQNKSLSSYVYGFSYRYYPLNLKPHSPYTHTQGGSVHEPNPSTCSGLKEFSTSVESVKLLKGSVADFSYQAEPPLGQPTPPNKIYSSLQ
jgi:hypothetical protein